MRDLVIFGAGGFGREVCQVVEDINAAEPAWNVLGFLDGNDALHGTTLRDLPILGGPAWLAEHPGVVVALAIGFPTSKRAVLRAIADAASDVEFATLVHPTAWVGNHVTVGRGTVILAGAAVSTDIRIGAFNCLNKNCIVGHDAVLGDYSTVSPGASISGYVQLGEGCDIGANSVVVQGYSIGAWSVVGAGAVVAGDLPADVTAVGIPARVIKQRAATASE
jgi:sugar O-acyltransferase (sialic acid O-acetyltransferase NeuD family)